MKRNHTNWKMRKLFKGIFMLLLLFALPFIIMGLWNAILPEISQMSSINYWQALGLFILSRIFFGGFRCGGRSHGGRAKFRGAGFRQKFMNMTEEERVAFKQRWKERCGQKS